MDNQKYPYDPERVLVVHASSVRMNGGALIFLGPSGAGKSTICGLFDGLAQPLTDDITYLVHDRRGEWRVAAVGDKGKRLPESKVLACELVPLQAVFRIHQASLLQLEPIEPIETCHCLAAAAFEVRFWLQYGARARKQMFSHVATIARSVPGYQLHFTLTQETAERIASEIGS